MNEGANVLVDRGSNLPNESERPVRVLVQCRTILGGREREKASKESPREERKSREEKNRRKRKKERKKKKEKKQRFHDPCGSFSWPSRCDYRDRWGITVVTRMG